MLKAAIYARVSTDKQDAGNQIPDMQALAARRGYEIVETYTEQETAWKAGHQAELARLLKDARRRRFDVVIVWALDRLCRQGGTAMTVLINSLNQYGVGVISHQEAWMDTTGAFREILICFIGWMAQFESQRRSERTKAGLKNTLAKGVTKAGKRISQLGRPKGSKDGEKRTRRYRRRPLIV
jgi:DNA invertase Pin-like site-specific DNA recombinase